MYVQKYYIKIADSAIAVRVENWNSIEPKLWIDDGGGKVYFDIENFSNAMKLMKELSLVTDLKEKNKSINLNEYIRFHRTLNSDPSKAYNYDFRIRQTEKKEIVTRSVHIKGIEQLNLVKDALIKLHEKCLSDRWLDEKIKSEGLKYVEYDNTKYDQNSRIII